jgi:hypothetical protein
MTGVTYGTSYNTRTITSRGNVYQATFDPAKSEDLGDKTKYYGISIDMTKNNIDTNEIWIKWNDLYDDFNYFGASIDGNVIITLKGNGNQKYSIKPSVDYNIDSRSCECNGFSNGEPACNVSSKNYCVSGMEQDPVFEGFAYTNMHFTLPTTMEIRSFDFNLITSKNVENLSYFVTPLGTKDLQDLNIYVTNREETRSILTGDFRLYPAEGLTYILEDLGYDDATAGLTQKEMFCIQEQANKAKYIDGNIYWIEPTLLSYDFASPECSNPNKNLLGRVGKIADSNKLLRSGSGYDSAWIEKGFSAWTSKCREIDDVLRIGKKKTVCEVYEKSANDSFKLKEIDSTGYALPMCVSSAETGTYDTSSNCANIVTCTNDTVNKVCALSNSVVQNTFQDTGFLTLINPSVKVETVDVKSGTQDLPNGTMIVWVEGRFLKARFFGEDNPQYNSGNIPMLLEKTYGTGTQYSIINIKDYVNSGKTRKQ